MLRNGKFYLICVIIGLGLLVIQSGLRCTSDVNIRHMSPDQSILYSVTRNNLVIDGEDSLTEFIPKNQDGSPNIEKIYEETRIQIKYDLLDYNFTHSDVQKLEDLLIDSGGNPVRSLVISAWRSGSTFLGDLINAMPSNFFHNEPLKRYRIKQIRGPPNAEMAITSLKRMLRCDFRGIEDYFGFGKTDISSMNQNNWDQFEQFERNKRLWILCKHKLELCLDANFVSNFCKLFPFQSIKETRLRLHLVEDILEDEKLEVKVVFLIRDPRAVLHSRRHRDWCQTEPDCIQPDIVCADMASDYAAARRLTQKYHDKVMVLRFEDFALNLNERVPKLLEFLRRGPPTLSLKKFLDEHTASDSNLLYSTFRITRDVPFKWKKGLDFEYVHKIQEACKVAMDLWGYKPAHNATHMASELFYPLDTFSLM